MNVFIPHTKPIDCALILSKDSKRFWKQILEGHQILDAISGRKQGWKNHPVVKMYSKNYDWLDNYIKCLESFREGNLESAEFYSNAADNVRPDFITKELCDQHKRRLFTKNDKIYSEFFEYGVSQENWYIVNGMLLKYIDGKRINHN